jgi:endoplasmic reticulum protein 29
MTLTDSGSKGKIIVEAETIKENLNADKAKKAEIYIKIMHKVVSEGEKFIDKETERVTKLLDGKVSESKKKQLEQRINILKSFARQKSKDEL